MRRPLLVSRLQQVDETNDVALYIEMRVLQRISHAGLGRKVNDCSEFVPGKQKFHGAQVGNIHLDELESRLGLESLKPRLFPPFVIELIQVVDADDLPPLFQQPSRYVKPDEPCGAGYQHGTLTHSNSFAFPSLFESVPLSCAHQLPRPAACYQHLREDLPRILSVSGKGVHR